jgi:hypothetical protein
MLLSTKTGVSGEGAREPNEKAGKGFHDLILS